MSGKGNESSFTAELPTTKQLQDELDEFNALTKVEIPEQ